MTVEQLIERLKQVPGHLPVATYADGHGWNEIKDEPLTVMKDDWYSNESPVSESVKGDFVQIGGEW